jgi:hypothetical protein
MKRKFKSERMSVVRDPTSHHCLWTDEPSRNDPTGVILDFLRPNEKSATPDWRPGRPSPSCAGRRAPNRKRSRGKNRGPESAFRHDFNNASLFQIVMNFNRAITPQMIHGIWRPRHNGAVLLVLGNGRVRCSRSAWVDERPGNALGVVSP